MRIVVDAMGSDNFPVPDVAGAVLAAREASDTLILVGDEARIQPELAKHDTTGLKIEVVHAAHAVSMTDKPTIAAKEKPDSSMHVGMRLVKEGRAEAFVSAGNTGAILTIATLYTLRRIEGVKRPAISAVFSLGTGDRIMVLDAGANTEGKPEWLAQFATMGSLYAQRALGMVSPRVGVLTNGEEEGKGTPLTQETAALLRTMPLNFVGNVEPKDLAKHNVDVVVTDGFTGNLVIKTMEAATSAMSGLIREEVMRDTVSRLGGLLARSAFRRVYRRVDPFEIGGAPLLGVNGVVIIGHGRSNAKAIKNAVRQARAAVESNVIHLIREGIAQTPVVGG